MLRYLEYCFYKYCYLYTKWSKRLKKLNYFWGERFVSTMVLLNVLTIIMCIQLLLYKKIFFLRLSILTLIIITPLDIIFIDHFSEKKYEELKNKYQGEKNAKLKELGVFLYSLSSIIIVVVLLIIF